MIGRLLAVVVLVFAAGLFFGMKDGKSGREKVVRMSMVHGCQDTNADKGLPAETTSAWCECTIDKLLAKHGYKKIDRSIPEDPAQMPAWLVRDMRGSAEQCAAEMDLEITFPN